MHAKDGMADNQKLQASEGNTNHIRAMPQGSAMQRQKNRHIRGHNKTV